MSQLLARALLIISVSLTSRHLFTIMTNDIGNMIIPVPAAQPQAQSSSSTASTQQNNTNTANTTDSTQSNAPTSQNTAANSNDASSQNAASGHNSHFSKLLAGSQKSSAAPASTTKTQAAKPATDTKDTSSDNNVAVVSLIVAQLPANTSPTPSTDTQDDTQEDVTVVSGSVETSSTPTPGPNLQQQIALLEKILQGLEQGQQANAATNDDSGTYSTTAKAMPLDTASIFGILSQLVALFHESQNQPATTSDIASITAVSVQDATNTDTSSATTLLNKLAAVLMEKLSGETNASSQVATAVASTGNASVKTQNTKENSAITVTSSTSDATSSQTGSNTDTLNNLQSTLTQIIALLTPGHSDKAAPANTATDISAITQDTSNTLSASANAASQIAAHMNNNQPQATDNDFAKLLSASTSHAPVADQVLVQIRNATSDGASQVKILLEPAELGKVVVQMNTGTDGKTGVTITADNRQTLALLQNEAKSLESALRDIGLKTDTGGLNFNLSGQQQHSQNPGKQQNYTQVAAVTATDDEADYTTMSIGVYPISAVQGLDIRV